jgi:hypothetical protein
MSFAPRSPFIPPRHLWKSEARNSILTYLFDRYRVSSAAIEGMAVRWLSPGTVCGQAVGNIADIEPRPILTPKTVLPLFFTIGIIFAPIGGLLLYASAQVGHLDCFRRTRGLREIISETKQIPRSKRLGSTTRPATKMRRRMHLVRCQTLTSSRRSSRRAIAQLGSLLNGELAP